MKKLLIVLALIAISTSSLYSAFTVTQIVTSEFPYVKVNFVATKENGQKYTDLNVNDFIVKENGVNMSPTLELSCQDTEGPAELSILLVLDKSGSMETNPDDGIRRWDWVVEGARKFLETLKFEGRTKVAVTTFSLDAKLLCDFTNDRQMLIDTIEKTVPFGPTFYNPPFIDADANAVDLLSSQPADMNRVCIFLTDGLPEPGEKNKTEEIFKAMQNANIQVYTITLMMPMTTNLSRIAHETGGKSFEVRKREELTDIYELIAIEAQSRQICELKWLSHYGCDEKSREREVTIDFLRDLDPNPKDRSYIAPENSIAKLVSLDGGLLSFGNPEVNAPVTKTSKFIVKNGPFTYSGFTITPPTFFNMDKVRINGVTAKAGDVALPNDTVEVDIVFTQKTAKEYRQALFTLEGSFCPGNISLTGGYSKVVLVNPQTEVYSPCDGIEIKWAGVEENTLVNLYYTTNGGANWNTIIKNISGGYYLWKPNLTSNTIKVKVEKEARQFYKWVVQGKNQYDGIASGIALDTNDTYVYTTGYFQETLDFLGNTKVSKGGTDFFLAKQDRDGFPQWVITGGTDKNDSISSVVISDKNEVFVAGTSYQGMKFGVSTAYIKHPDVAYGFISKVSANGDVLKSITFGADLNASSQLWVRGARYEPVNDRIAVVGNYSGKVDFPSGISFTGNGTFIAYYDDNLDFLNAVKVGYNVNDYKNYSSTDKTGNIFRVNTFSGKMIFDADTLTSQDAKDFAVSCYGLVQSSEDISKGNVSLQKPSIKFNIPKADVGSTVVGDIGTRVFSAILVNNGSLPIVPNTTNIVGEFTDEFTLKSALPKFISPAEELPLEFSFAPKKLGNRSATFTITNVCGDPISLELVGIGTCKGESVDLVDAGKKTIGIRSKVIANDIFQNPTSQVIRITPLIENDPSSEFEIYAIDQNGVEQATINVSAFSSATFAIYFNPKFEGTRTAKINFGVNSECENTYSDLKGEGINSSIVGAAPEIVNRIRTVNTGKITLENMSDLLTEISDLQIVNDPNNYFSLKNVNASYSIQGNQSIEIDYEFIPMTEGVYTPKLQYKLASGSLDSSTILKGTGLFPELEVVYSCADDAVQGQTSSTKIKITNKSKLTDVDLISITSNTNEFKFDNGTLVSGSLNIPANSSKELEVLFTPSKGGYNSYDFTALADVAIGNHIDNTFKSDSTLPAITGECDASPSLNSDNYDFGNIIVCDKPGTYSYTIKNNASSPLIINKSDVVITPSNGIFTINMPNTLNIPVGGESQVEIIFTPIANINYNASVSFINNLSIDYTLNLTGKGVYIDLKAKSGKDELVPGELDKITFGATIPKITNYTDNSQWNIQKITINVKYNNKVVNIKDSSLIDKTNGLLTWMFDRLSYNEFNLVGTGDLPTPYSKDLASIDYYLNLSDDYKSLINYNIYVENCDAGSSVPITVKLSEFCARDFRIFEYSGIESSIEPVAPNPVSNNVIIKYSNSFEGPVKIEISNSIGLPVQTPVNDIKVAGVHQFELDVNSLPNGIYFIHYTSLQKSETIKFIVNK